MMRCFRPVLPALSILLISCTGNGESNLILWTDQPGMAHVVEIYNRTNKNMIELEYVENAAAALDAVESIPDLIIAENLASRRLFKHYHSLGDLVYDAQKNKEGIDLQLFYPGILDACYHLGKPVLLPLGFNVPVVGFKKDLPNTDVPPLYIDLSALRKIGAAYNQEKGANSTLGFSPLWEGCFTFYTAQLFHAEFREDENGNPVWNEAGLNSAIDFMREWHSEWNIGPEFDDNFYRKYVTKPGYILVIEERTRFGVLSLKTYNDIPVDKRGLLDFRYLSHEGRISACENLLYAAIHSQSRQKKAAAGFISWLFTPQTQFDLIKENKRLEISCFGLLDGLSAFVQVNEVFMPQVYSYLVGYIPPSRIIDFSPALPVDWPGIKTEVVIPWLSESITGEQNPLGDRITLWKKQRSP